jgi:hypothetical protein
MPPVGLDNLGWLAEVWRRKGGYDLYEMNK